jgi:antitoxin (DNA-binding transcriptional repressor) of toxin-antitoxin stability system
MRHMKAMSLKELHKRTSVWVRKAVEIGALLVTERGKPVVRLEAVVDVTPTNPFRVRRLRPGYARLRGKLGRGTDSAATSPRIATEGRAREPFARPGAPGRRWPSSTIDRSSAARHFPLKAMTVVPA